MMIMMMIIIIVIINLVCKCSLSFVLLCHDVGVIKSETQISKTSCSMVGTDVF
jgi:hypothetical protein